MQIAKVVGNVVSTIKDAGLSGYKLMIVAYDGGKREIVFDAADAGIGDTVLVVKDGGASSMILEDDHVVADSTICGVIDHYTVESKIIK